MPEERPFIDAKDNRFVSSFFYGVSRFLAGRSFRNVWLKNEYGTPSPDRSTLYFGNHNAWWDALTPLLLNQKVLKQHPRAVMEWEQVKRFPFFRRIGCFSIDRTDHRSAVTSLVHGVNWLNEKPGRSLFFYPEGKITHPALDSMHFETGIGWMVPKLKPHVDLVPLVQHIHAMHHPKPSLFIYLGKPVHAAPDQDKKSITLELQKTTEKCRTMLAGLASPKEPEMDQFL